MQRAGERFLATRYAVIRLHRVMVVTGRGYQSGTRLRKMMPAWLPPYVPQNPHRLKLQMILSGADGQRQFHGGTERIGYEAIHDLHLTRETFDYAGDQ